MYVLGEVVYHLQNPITETRYGNNQTYLNASTAGTPLHDYDRRVELERHYSVSVDNNSPNRAYEYRKKEAVQLYSFNINLPFVTSHN